jgi:putative tryptophan/tyrosine transport system substrate-binding protein
MRRRDLFVLLGAAATLQSIAVRAQQAIPVIGFLHQGAQPAATLMAAFADGLGEAGLRQGRDVIIEHQAADGHYERLPLLAQDLVSRQVAVIAADFLPASLAAKAATETIPIVFLTGSDPIAAGLVSSFSRPTGNVTGVAFLFTRLGPKNLEFLHELLPDTAVVAVLVNQTNPNGPPQVDDLQTAARSLGVKLEVFHTSTAQEIDQAFARLAERSIRGAVVTADGFLIAQQGQLVTLAAKHAIPTVYPLSQYVSAGGLMSYGASLPAAFHETGTYVGRILKGAKPSDLPVIQSAKFELVINLKATKALGLTVPPSLLARADEVIE